MDRKIVTIAEIGFALVFVMILSFIFYNIYGYSNDLNLDVETMQEVVNEADLAPYDNKTVSGDTVMSTINKMKEAKGGLSMSYGVCNGSTATASNWQFYGYGALKYASGEGNPAYYADGDEADNVYVALGDFGWSDLGTWSSLYELSPKDKTENVTLKCKSLLYNCKDNIVVLPENKLAVIDGLEGYLIAEADDVLLICRKDEEHAIRKYVNDAQIKMGDEYI